MNPNKKIVLHLPQYFSKTHYDMVFEFMGKSFIFYPSHIHDLMQESNIHKPIRINNEDPIDLNYVKREHVHNGNECP
jgi:hypothetical protein